MDYPEISSTGFAVLLDKCTLSFSSHLLRCSVGRLKDCQDALLQLQEEFPNDGKPARTTPDAKERISKLPFLEALKLVNNLLTMLKVLLQLKEKALTRAGLVEDDVISLINERVEVRRNKDFLKSDQMRAHLQVKGIALMDVGMETIWRPCVPVQQESEVVPSEGQKVPPKPETA
ncbi:hypothetical protein GOBAR_DD04275 [Gossypium barbadense]|nr:hypothetical protein GOBAR_DD04275 [Gossypium barbadense]